MLKRLMLICFIIVLTISGCNSKNETTNIPDNKESEEDKIEKPSADNNTSSEKNMEVYEIQEKEQGTYKATVEEFNLGAGEYTAQSGKVMPYDLRGIIGVPEGEGKFPLVLITHGSHSNIDEKLRFDTGFTYLVEKLAKNGYVTVSMDMSKAYIWKYGDSDDKEKSIYLADEHIKNLNAANAGEKVNYTVNLKGKINFDEVALIGHSRGGEAIFDIALSQQQKGIPINALLAIAPTIPSDVDTKEWPDTNVSIIVPEYDGDVISLDGLSIQRVLEEKSGKMSGVTVLNRGNHNYFNTNLKENDATLGRTEDLLTDQLSPEQQQTFLKNYTVDFMNGIFQNKIDGTIYDVNMPSANKVYGFDVMSRVSYKEDKIITDISKEENFMDEGAVIESTTDSWFFQKDKTIIDTITFGQDKYQTKSLLNIKWKQKGEKLSFHPIHSDFSNFKALTLNMVIDAADSLNEGQQYQAFTITLTDTNGNKAAVTLPQKINSLRNIPGKLDVTPLEDKEIKFWTVPTPICNTRIPLELFENIDFKSVDSVAVDFNQTNSGAVYMESILLQ